MAPKKKLHLNFFEMACNSAHMGLGMWKSVAFDYPTLVDS